MPSASSPSLLFIDVESVGLNGPCKLIQFALNDSPVQMITLKKGWESNAETLRQLDLVYGYLYDANVTAVGFNIGFDYFHLYRTWHSRLGYNQLSRQFTVKPFLCKTKDLMIDAQLNGPFAPWAFSKKKGASKVRIGKIPTPCLDIVAERVMAEVDPLLPPHSTIHYSEHEVKGRKDLKTLSFGVTCSIGLKAHMEHWGEKVIKLKDCWPLPEFKEQLHLPYWGDEYAALEEEADRVLSDPSSPFFTYAADDIRYTRRMFSEFQRPRPNHHDSTVAAVAFTRYYGIPLDRTALQESKSAMERRVEDARNLLVGVDLGSWQQKLKKLKEYVPFAAAANKKVLEGLAAQDFGPEANAVIKAMLSYGSLMQRLNQMVKALECKTGKLHVDLKVCGTATGRMAGTGAFNIQGVAKEKPTDPSYVPGFRTAILTRMVGDFTAFEVTLAAAVWNDKQLLQDLTDGTDIHLMAASLFHPKWPKGLKYEDADKRDPLIAFCRDQAKTTIFAILYGAEVFKIASILKITEAQALEAMERLFSRWPTVKKYRAERTAEVVTGDTEKWKEDSVARMKSSVTDLTGYTRHFDFEKTVADKLWRLASKKWDLPLGETIRQEEKGKQTYKQAVRSGLLGAALGLQKAVARQLINSPIQGTGANFTKQLGALVWETYHTPFLNNHDELVFIDHENLDTLGVQSMVKEWIRGKKALVPHIEFDLKETERWSDK